jgi:hypothetical protein
MGAGTKTLAGCGCLAIVGAAVLVAGLGVGTWWLKDRAYDLTDGLEALVVRNHELETWERKANAHPYERRDDGVVLEERLLAFLDVRRRVHEVYASYESELVALREQAQDRTSPTTDELLAIGARAAEMFAELRLAQLKALTEAGMSEPEYSAIRTAVYVAAAAAKAESGTGKLPAEAVSQATRRLQETLRAGLERAREEGLPGMSGVSDSDLERLDEALSRMSAGGSEALTVPPANVTLFRKYEDEIEKYAMHGLAVLGL